MPCILHVSARACTRTQAKVPFVACGARVAWWRVLGLFEECLCRHLSLLIGLQISGVVKLELVREIFERVLLISSKQRRRVLLMSDEGTWLVGVR